MRVYMRYDWLAFTTNIHINVFTRDTHAHTCLHVNGKVFASARASSPIGLLPHLINQAPALPGIFSVGHACIAGICSMLKHVCACVVYIASPWLSVGGYIHAHANTCTHRHAHTQTSTHTHTHTRMISARARADTRIHTHPHAYTRIHTHTQMHARARAHTHTHTGSCDTPRFYNHQKLSTFCMIVFSSVSENIFLFNFRASLAKYLRLIKTVLDNDFTSPISSFEIWLQ